MSKLRQFTAISAAALVTAMVSVPAYAQESNDTSAVGNPEIVVIASGVSCSFCSRNCAVTTISGLPTADVSVLSCANAGTETIAVTSAAALIAVN